MLGGGLMGPFACGKMSKWATPCRAFAIAATGEPSYRLAECWQMKFDCHELARHAPHRVFLGERGCFPCGLPAQAGRLWDVFAGRSEDEETGPRTNTPCFKLQTPFWASPSQARHWRVARVQAARAPFARDIARGTPAFARFRNFGDHRFQAHRTVWPKMPQAIHARLAPAHRPPP